MKAYQPTDEELQIIRKMLSTAKIRRDAHGNIISIEDSLGTLKVNRYPDGRIHSIEGSDDRYEYWIDEKGECTSMWKDKEYEKLILRSFDEHDKLWRSFSKKKGQGS